MLHCPHITSTIEGELILSIIHSFAVHLNKTLLNWKNVLYNSSAIQNYFNQFQVIIYVIISRSALDVLTWVNLIKKATYIKLDKKNVNGAKPPQIKFCLGSSIN